MHILLVHGLGRTPASMLGLARHLRRRGHTTVLAGYVAAMEPFEHIRARVRARLIDCAHRGDCMAIGHSLGGVLLRAAIADLPAGCPLPRLLITLGSPTRPPRLAQRLRDRWFFRRFAGEAGQRLADAAYLASVAHVPVPWVAIAGTRGFGAGFGPFGAQANDGVVAVDETLVEGTAQHLRVHAVHTFLMNDRAVRARIDQCIDDLVAGDVPPRTGSPRLRAGDRS